ncbi:MAG TPA: trypsin-like peptidase domain-containing protein [Pirellulales bacterium]|nr:trypsin-like peptidase domain-containing protein [Pirellulales bacterium]
MVEVRLREPNYPPLAPRHDGLARRASLTRPAAQRPAAQRPAPQRPAGPRSLRGRLVVAAAICLLGGLLLRPAQAQEPAGLEAAVALERVLVQAIGSAERSVVSIARVSQRGDEAGRDLRVEAFQPLNPPLMPHSDNPTDPEFVPNEFATGVVVDRSGLILTNYHVIDPGSAHYVTTVDRKVFQTKIHAADPRSDLAVLKIVDAVAGTEFFPIKFGNAKGLKKGQIVISLGNPYAIARDGQASASWGIVSNLARKVAPRSSEEESTLHQYGTLIQTDAKLNLGTSGGALLNLKGEMVGLTTALAATAGYEQAAGYAIPVDETFLRIIETLKKGREVEYGFLGVAPINLAAHEVLRGKQGMRVERVNAGTPAKRAGLQREDVITHVNGEPIFDADGLRLQVGKLPAASVATLTIERDGKAFVEQVTLAKYKVRGKKVATVREPDWRGLRIDFPSAVLIPQVLDETYESAVAVSEIAEDSPAYRAGLRVGMLITNVGKNPVDTPADFRREVAARQGDVPLKIMVGPGDYHVIVIKPQ